MLAVMTALTGVAYPLLVTGVAQAAFPTKANGDPALIGQSFESPKYFWGRLSATTPGPYNAGSSTGSNLGPTNDQVKKNAEARIEALRKADPNAPERVPVDLVTSSASGLDPHISPEAAEYQVNRVAKARGISEDRVRTLVRASTDDRQLGFLGEPRVDVLSLNQALDHIEAR
jgi:K+-transporting ATPase ATPase C chain